MTSARDRSGIEKNHNSPEFRSGTEPYAEMKFDLGDLQGFSEEQVQVHLELYAGYVKNVNTLNGELAELSGKGKAGGPAWSELKRRLGFEYDGMRLHEYYFGNLKGGTGRIAGDSRLARALAEGFGSVEAWKKEFTKMSEIRGIGWVITYLDPWTRKLSNHWVTLHEEGHPSGFRPIVVMDLWEHAYMVDWRPATKAKYVETFLAHLDYEACERRLEHDEPVAPGRGGKRSGN